MRQLCKWSTTGWRWHIWNYLTWSHNYIPAPALKRNRFPLILPLNNNLNHSQGWSHPPLLLLTRNIHPLPPVDSCEKQRVTVCQNHNKPLLRQSLTGFPSGSCVTSWDNETAAPQPTTCSLSFTWFITPPLLCYGQLTEKSRCYLYTWCWYTANSIVGYRCRLKLHIKSLSQNNIW